MSQLAQSSSLFEIDQELDSPLDEIEEQTENEELEAVCPELIRRFEAFCQSFTDKVDRIGRFLSQTEARSKFCRARASRLSDQARPQKARLRERKAWSSTFCGQVLLDYCDVEARIPGRFWRLIQSEVSEERRRQLHCYIRNTAPSLEAIKAAAAANEPVPGAEVRRGFHLRVA